MKKIAILSLLTVAAWPQAWTCTSLIAGKQATADGSVLVTYSADSHTLYGALTSSPATDWPKGSMRKIVEWDTNKPLGEIEQVEHTYAVVGNMNEHQLTIVESTWGGRPELVDTTGIIDYGSLIQLGLERAKTAREAIKVMTGLVKKYGYCSSGESFTIADPNEVWIMDLIGKGPGRRGAVWVAVRIPDDCIAGHANYPRIHQIPLDDKENCLYSPDVISFAREMGYFDGLNKDFSFAQTYYPADFGALRACDARVWAFFRKYDATMDSYLPYINGETYNPFPLYIKPSRKLSVQDMKEAMRDHFEGTPFDMTQDVGAGPFKVPYRFRPMSFEVEGKSYCMERAIATQQTGFTLVGQMRNWLPDAVGGVLWFGVDDANTCIYVARVLQPQEWLDVRLLLDLGLLDSQLGSQHGLCPLRAHDWRYPQGTDRRRDLAQYPPGRHRQGCRRPLCHFACRCHRLPHPVQLRGRRGFDRPLEATGRVPHGQIPRR